MSHTTRFIKSVVGWQTSIKKFLKGYIIDEDQDEWVVARSNVSPCGWAPEDFTDRAGRQGFTLTSEQAQALFDRYSEDVDEQSCIAGNNWIDDNIIEWMEEEGILALGEE